MTTASKSSFKTDYEYSVNELKCIAKAAGNAMKTVLASDGFGFLIGLMVTLIFMSDDPIVPGAIGAGFVRIRILMTDYRALF